MIAVSEYNDTDFFDRRRVNCDIVNTLREVIVNLKLELMNCYVYIPREDRQYRRHFMPNLGLCVHYFIVLQSIF